MEKHDPLTPPSAEQPFTIPAQCVVVVGCSPGAGAENVALGVLIAQPVGTREHRPPALVPMGHEASSGLGFEACLGSLTHLPLGSVRALPVATSLHAVGGLWSGAAAPVALA